MSEMHSTTGIPQWDVADRMGKALRESGLTVTEMADYFNVHRNTISGYLHGHHSPPRPTLILWAMRTGVPLEWLLTGTSEGPRPDQPDEGTEQVRREGLEPPTRWFRAIEPARDLRHELAEVA